MFFRQVINEDLGCASYLIADPDSGQACVVDPQWDIAPYLALASQRGVHITHVVETHTHADHVSGRGRLHEATGCTLWVSPLAGVKFLHQPLADGTTITLGAITLTAIALPGHRPEHTGLLVHDTTRSAEPWAVLTGDCMFVGDCGRPDLAIDAADGAHDQYHSVQRLLDLPDHVEVWPGHLGGSLCGSAAISAKTSSTIGFERRSSSLLQVRDAEEFTQAQLATLSVKPPDLDRVVALNEGPLVTAPAPAPALDGAELLRRAKEGAVVIDGRSAAAFAAAHVPGSISVPQAGGGFATRAGLAAPRDADLLLVGSDEAQARAMGEQLAAVGRQYIAGVLAGGFSAYLDEGLATTSLERIRAEAFPDLLLVSPDMAVLDCREEREVDAGGTLIGAVCVPYWQLREGLPADLEDVSGPVAVICASGKRAGSAASLLRRHGIARVIHVDQGGVGMCHMLGLTST